MEKADTFIQAIIIISSIFTLVAVFVIAYILYFNKRKSALLAEKRVLEEEFRRQIQQSQVEVQEQTFQNIGKELHDNVGQLLSTAKMLLGITERSMTPPPDTLLSATATLGQAIHELRTFSRSLDTDWLQQFRFIENLKTEIARINSGGMISAELVRCCPLNLDAEKQVMLFRIVQEGIQNAIKHAGARIIQISAENIADRYRIAVSDDGKGLPALLKGMGMGLSNMKHRTTLLGGTISWESLPGEGTNVVILLPINYDDL